MSGSMNLDRSEIIEWRNAERAKIISSVGKRFAGLEARLSEEIAELGTAQLMLPKAFSRRIEKVISDWIEQQNEIIRRQLKLSAQTDMALHHHDQIQPYGQSPLDVLEFGAGAVLGVAPLAVVPVAATLVTVTTGTAFLATSTISIPATAALTAGAVVVTGTGVVLRKRGSNKRRIKLQAYWLDRARRMVLDRKNRKSPSLLSRLLNDVNEATSLRMEAL